MSAQSPLSLDRLLDGVLKRLTPLVKPFRDSKSGEVKTTTALDTALVWTFNWSRVLRKGRNTFNEILLQDFAKCLRHVIFAWTVEHPKLFSSSSDVDPAFLRSHHLEKEKIETVVYATKQFMRVLLHETVSEAVLNPVKGAGTVAADDTKWRDPRAGWQGVLLRLLEGLCNHLETRNPASAPNSQNDLSAYRDYIGVELVQGLVNIVFPSMTGKPTGPGDPIKDYKGHPVFALEVKFAALDVLVESLRRQIGTASALRKLLPFETTGSVLHSGYDMHLSALMIDIAYRLLPGRRKSSAAMQAMSKRFTALEALFPEEGYGRNEADELRKLFDALDKGDWTLQSSEILHRISFQHIKRAQGFLVHDFRSDGAHLLPTRPGKASHDPESLTATDVISQRIFVPTTVWFGRDSLTVLIDEPPEMTQRRMLEERGTPDIRPSSGQLAVDETRDARAVVHYSAIHKVYVRRLDSAKEDDYRITILSDKSLQIDGRPHTSDMEATHYGLENDSSAPLEEEKAYHKLELLVAAEKANLGLLKKVLQDRMQRYPRLGAELGNWPAVPPPPAGKGSNFVMPAPKAVVQPSADAQALSTATAAAAAGGGGTSKSSAPGPARVHAPNKVPQAPLRTSQANVIDVTPTDLEPEPEAGTGVERANGKVVVEEEGGTATTGDADDLGRRRDKLAAMAREGSPATTSATSTRRRSKETEQDAAAAAAPETGDLLETYDFNNNNDFGGGFEDEEAREAAFDAEISNRKEHQSEEDEMPSPGRLGRSGGHRQRSASPQLDNNSRKVDSEKSTKSKLPPPLPGPDDNDNDDDKVGKAKKPRQAKSPVPAKPAPPRRSARLSPPPAKPQGEKAKTGPSRSGAQDAVGKEGETSESEPEERSRSRRGAAQNKKKQVVQPTTKQKRDREDEEEDELEDEKEAISSLSESSDGADSANRRKKMKGPARASKRRKVEDKQEADKGDETDYEEHYSLPTKEQRRSDRRKFGKTFTPFKGNGTTRKANQSGPKSAGGGKPSSRTGNTPGSKASSERGSKAGKKGPTKPAGKVVAGTGDSASEMSTEDGDGRVPAQSTRASRSKAKKVVASVSAEAAGSSEEEERSPKKKGDKRIADDIPPPADLTASEQLRVQRAGIRSPAISPAKAKPVQTLDQLTGNAPVPIEEPAAFDQAMEITQEGAEEQQDVFEAPFEFDFAVADVAEIEAVCGPMPAKPTSAAPIETGASPKDVPAPPLPSSIVDMPTRVFPQTVPSASGAKPSTAGGDVPSTAGGLIRSAVAVSSIVKPQAVPSQERPSVTTAVAAAKEDAPASASVPPAEKPVRSVGGVEVASATASTAASRSNAAPGEKRPQRPLPSEHLPKPGTARGHVGAPVDDSGVHFVANDIDVTRAHKKGGSAADSHRPVADSMDLDTDEHNIEDNVKEAGAKTDAPFSATPATPAVIPSLAPHRAIDFTGPAGAAEQHRGESTNAPRTPLHQEDVRPLQSTPARHTTAKRPPESFMPWSAIPIRTAALRQGTSRPVKLILPEEVRQKAQSAPAAASDQKTAHAVGSAARRSQQMPASPGHPAPAGAGHRASANPSRMPGSRIRNKTDKIVLEERPLDCYEEFFDLLVDMGRALVRKQQEKAADLQERRKAGTQKVEKLVARTAQRDNVETREIARMVVQRAAALGQDGTSPSLQACAQDVGDNCAVLAEEVRELRRKLAAEKVA